MALFKPATPASTEVNRRTTDTPVGPVALLLMPCEFRRRYRNRRSNRRSIWFIIKIRINHKALETFTMVSQPATPAGNQVNLLLHLLLQERGDYLALSTMLETRSHRMTKRNEFALQTGEAQLVPFHIHLPPSTSTPCRNRKERHQPTVCAATDDNGTPATWTI